MPLELFKKKVKLFITYRNVKYLVCPVLSMDPLWLYVVLCTWVPVGHSTRLEVGSDQFLNTSTYNPSYQDLAERAAKHGYSVIEHIARTDDGYLLTIFRVRGPGSLGTGPPVVLMHGLLQNAAMWLDLGPNSALGYLLPSAGYDLWLGSVRGTHYSRRHSWFNPDSDPCYWNFSVDEIGRYDIPAIVDYVIKHTGAEKLNYIGYSQGAATFFIMCSERPEYCPKVKLMIALAPSSRNLYTKSFLFRSLTQFYNIAERELFKIGIWEVFPRGGLFNSFLRNFCALSVKTYVVCEVLKDALDGSNPGSITPASLKAATENFPTGTSVHNMAWYGQAMDSIKFRKFDYGDVINVKMYGGKCAPSYNLSAVTVPTLVMYGNNDGIVDVKDVKWLVGKLPNVVDAVEVRHRKWSHLDMHLSRLVRLLVFPKIDEYLRKYSQI